MATFQYGMLVEGVTSTATAAGTTSLTSTSSQIQVFTGSTTQTVKLPATTGMAIGQFFEIYNTSTGALTIQFQDASTFAQDPTINPSSCLVVKLVSTGTTNGTWVVQNLPTGELNVPLRLATFTLPTLLAANGATNSIRIVFTGNFVGKMVVAAHHPTLATHPRVDAEYNLSFDSATTASGQIATAVKNNTLWDTHVFLDTTTPDLTVQVVLNGTGNGTLSNGRLILIGYWDTDPTITNDATTPTGSEITTGTLLVTTAGVGQVGIGGFDNVTTSDSLQLVGTGANSTGIKSIRYSADTSGPSIRLQKSRGAALGTLTAVASGDTMGSIFFNGIGTDAAAYSTAARVFCEAEGTIGSAIIPGRIRLQTANSAGTLVEAVRIDSGQNVRINTTSNISNTNERLTVLSTITTDADSSGIMNRLITNVDAALTNAYYGITSEYRRQITNSQTDGNQQRVGIRTFNSFVIPTGKTLTSSSAGIPEYIGILAAAVNLSGGGTIALSDYTHIYIESDSVNTGTNKYGMYVGDQSGATTNYALYTSAGLVRIGDQATFNGGASTTFQATFQPTSGGNPGIRLLNPAASGFFNWKISAQDQTTQTLTITPSTVVDGTTFSTPVFSVAQSGTASVASAGTTSLDLNNTVDGGPRRIRFRDTNGSPTVKNFLIGAGVNSNNFEITPSTANGGDTYSTAAIQVDPTGLVSVGGSPSSGVRLTIDGLTLALAAVFNSTATNGVYTQYNNSSTAIGFVGSGKELVTNNFYTASASDFGIVTNGLHFLVLGTNDLAKMVINSTGNVGINVTPNSTHYLEMTTDGTYGGIRINSGTNNATNGGFLLTCSTRTLTDVVFELDNSGGASNFVMTADGKVRIGASTVDVTHLAQNSSTTNYAFSVTNNNANTASDSIPAMFIQKGSTTATSAQRFLQFINNAGATNQGYITANAGTPQFTAASDRRIKKDVATLSGALDKIVALNPVSFTLTATNDHGIGFIAQEFNEVFPEQVDKTDDGTGDTLPDGIEPWTMSEGRMVPYLVKALQELKAEFDAYVVAHP